MELGESLSILSNLKIDESSNPDSIPIDGKYILARVKGPMFFPDTPSRNRRWYPRQLWENVCSNPFIREKMNNRNLYSTISHEIPYCDETLAEGKYSHFITDMYIDENNQGICEFYILGTPSGRILNTHLRAGCRMYSSTRADGQFTNETYEGMPIVDPATYQFFGMDIVTEPGFLQAHPGLMESLKEDYKFVGFLDNQNQMKNPSRPLDETVKEVSQDKRVFPSGYNLTEKEITMPNENSPLLESLTKEATDARAKMSEALQENAKLQAELSILKEENKKMSEEFKTYKSDMKNLAMYEALGTPSDIEAVFDQVQDLRDKLDAVSSAKERMEAELGDADTIRSALSAAEKVMAEKSSFEKEFGTEEDIRASFQSAKELMDKLSAFEDKFGSFEDVESAISATEELVSALSQQEEELGSAEEIKEAYKKSTRLLEAYRKLGTPKQIYRAFKVAESIVAKVNENRQKQLAVRIANDINAQPKAVYEMLRKGLSESFIRKTADQSRYSKTGNGAAKVIRESMSRPFSIGDRLAGVFFHRANPQVTK